MKNTKDKNFNKKNIIKFISLIICCILSNNIFATAFTPPPTDKSVELLGTIFGSNIGATYLGGQSALVLSAIFEKLNVIVVSIGTIILSYIGIVSTINTAQEGQAMGKKWSSIWLPLRSMIGMLLMAPTPGSGYSVIQATVMWIIMQGIGAADAVWNTVLDYLSHGISSTSKIEIEDIYREVLLEDGDLLTKELLNAAICMQSIKAIANGYAKDTDGTTITASPFVRQYGNDIKPYPSRDIKITPVDLKSITRPQAVTYQGALYIGSRLSSHISKNKGDIAATEQQFCGKINVQATVDPSELSALNLEGSALMKETAKRAEFAYKQKIKTLQAMLTTLLPVANQIVKSSGTTSSPGFVSLSRDTYVNMISVLIRPTMAENTILDAVEKGRRYGWIAAGSYYFVLNQAMQQSLLDTANTPQQIPAIANAINSNISSIPSCKNNQDCSINNLTSARSLSVIKPFLYNPAEIKFIGSRLIDASIYAEQDEAVDGRLGIDTLINDTNNSNNNVFEPLQRLNTQAIQWLQDQISRDKNGKHIEDPLLGQANLGSKIMHAAEGIWFALVAMSIKAGGSASFILKANKKNLKLK